MEMTPILDPDSGEALYLQLYRSIRSDILQGRIAAGTKLPSIRRLCSRLDLSRTPVALAYAQLQAEGYIVSRPRSGLFAAELEGGEPSAPSSVSRAQRPPTNRKAAVAVPAPFPIETAPLLRAYHARTDEQVSADFGYGAVDLASFPMTRWKRLLNRALLPEHAGSLLYGDLQGEYGLRQEIAAYLNQSRGVRCGPEQIVVGAGTYHSLDLLLQLLEDEVTVLAAEEAVNDGVQALFRRFGYTGNRILPLPLEDDGIGMDRLTASAAEAVYLTPSHQFPYGMTLSARKRLRLLHWARERKAYLIENDYDGEFRYSGRPIPSLQGMDEDGRVIYVGTFSKALTPSFRLSYTVLPLDLLKKFRSGRMSYDQLASPLFQETLRLFMADGDLERHMRRMRILYQHKHDLLLEVLRQHFGSSARIIGAGSGLHILLQLPEGPGEAELITRAAARGVRVYPTSVYSLDPADAPLTTVLLGFGGLSPEKIRSGVRLLAEAWRSAES